MKLLMENIQINHRICFTADLLIPGEPSVINKNVEENRITL